MNNTVENKKEEKIKPRVLGLEEMLRLAYLPSKELADDYKTMYNFNIEISGHLPANDQVPRIYQGAIQAYNQGLFEVAARFFHVAYYYYDTPQKIMKKLKIVQP